MLTNSNELIGQTLGTCTLKRLIGRGGMGAVYLAQQLRPRRIVAVKVLLPHLVETRPREEFLARFRREADAIAALDHINIMPIYEYGEQREAAYLVMPYVTGGTLRERLEAQPIPPIEDVVSIIEQVADGLDSAHALGIIHRDLKPGNILFHADGRVLITDFGLAKMLKDATERDSGARVLTSAGSIIGTPEYLSPEQGTGNPTDYHTDIYALGVLLYQMLAGRVPFMGTTPVAVAIKHALQEPPPITQFNPAIPHSVQAVVMKALAKVPEQRFSSAGEMARALRLAISNESATAIWRIPDTKSPADTTIPTTDAPQPAEPVGIHTEQEKDGEIADNPTISLVEGPKVTNQDLENKTAQEANPLDLASQEETLQEKVTTLPTVLTGPDADELHNAPTIEGPPTGLQDEARQLFPHVLTPKEATKEDKLEPQAFHQEVESPAFLPEIEQPQHIADLVQDRPEEPTRHRSPVSHTPRAPLQGSQARLQPIWMMLIGGFLTLVIIIGGLAAYTHLLPISTTNSSATSKATSTLSSQNQTPTVIPSPALIPPAIPAGAVLYSTLNPLAGCDKQGGHWTNPSGAHVTCSANGSKIVNTSGHLVTANLDQLPGNQSPGPGENFIVQVQITINANAQGAFGIAFRPQGNNAQVNVVYLLDSSNQWSLNGYDTSGNRQSTLHSAPLPPSLSVPTKLTLDIRVVGTDYSFFINGQDTKGSGSTGSQYRNPIVGLAVDTNANVTFSNFAVYALP